MYYESLDLIRRHSLINYVQTGFHNFNITIKGEGFVADIMKSAVEGFNVKVDANVLLSNEPCLPQPVMIEKWYNDLFKLILKVFIRIYLFCL